MCVTGKPYRYWHENIRNPLQTPAWAPDNTVVSVCVLYTDASTPTGDTYNGYTAFMTINCH